MKKRIFAFPFVAVLLSVMLMACGQGQQSSPKTDEAKRAEGQTSGNTDQLTQERLRRFDSLDFQFYSNQMWDSLAISHDADIKVYYPDGTSTAGLFPQHIDRLKPLFAFAPDTKITKHPIKFGTGDWTTVVGEMEGTFSKPMPVGNGKTIPPTGKKFKLSMCTVGHWKGGKMIEEYLFWDNQSLMNQIGLGK
jgi:hypothetical protein